MKVLYVVQKPPPLHGVAVMNELVCSSPTINAGLSTLSIPVHSAADLDDLNRIRLIKVWRMLTVWWDTLVALTRFRPDVLYLAPVPKGIAFLRDAGLLLLGRVFRVRRVAHMHGVGIDKGLRGPLGWLYPVVFSGATVIDLSRQVGVAEWQGLSAVDIQRFSVPNALPSAVHQRLLGIDRAPSESTERNQPPQSAETLRLLFLSTAFRSKGILQLIDAFVDLRSTGLPLQLTVVGHMSTAVRVDVDKRLRQSNCASDVIFTGALNGEAKYRQFAAADLFVHPTLDDYFPLVILEAMASGLPIVASRIGAIPDMLDERSGLLVNAGDVAQIAAAIFQLLENKEHRAELGEGARQRYRECFAPQRFEQRMRHVLLGGSCDGA